MARLLFTPKKFIDALDLNEIKLTHLVQDGIDRSYFIPRYKRGSKKIKSLTYQYKKSIERKTIAKIAVVLIKRGLAQNEEEVLWCFVNDNYDILLPKDLL